MLERIRNFTAGILQTTGNGLRRAIDAAFLPFRRLGRRFGQSGWLIKTVIGLVVAGLFGIYAHFFYATQFWKGFDPDYARPLLASDVSPQAANVQAGDPIAPAANGATPLAAGQSPAPACKRSEIVAVSAFLVDFNVNRNAWISSMLVSKIGFFGIPWRNTPFFDNKAAFQLGINQVLRRTTTELVDTLGRMRGTSRIDQNLQDARTSLAWDETAWYIGLRGPTRPTPSLYRDAIRQLNAFNASLEKCQATFDARADNLLQFLDRIAGDIGSTTDILRSQMDASNAGWFDPRADDRFWFAYGQLYAYYGVLHAARADFSTIIRERNLTGLWDVMETQTRGALDIQPWIISNGNESSFLFPSHLATMGFNLLRARSQIVEIRSVLDK